MARRRHLREVVWHAAAELPAGHAPASGADSGDTRAYAASNPNLSAEILARMADDPSGDVRREVAHNKNTPADVVASVGQTWRQAVSDDASKSAASDALMAGRLESVAKAVAANPACPPAALRQMAAHNEDEASLLAAVIANDACPADVLESLVAHADSEVSVAAFAALKRKLRPSLRRGARTADAIGSS